MTIAEVIAFVQAVPKLVDLLEQFITWEKTYDLEAKMARIEALTDRLEAAVTAQEKLSAASSIDGVIHKL